MNACVRVCVCACVCIIISAYIIKNNYYFETQKYNKINYLKSIAYLAEILVGNSSDGVSTWLVQN